MSEWISVDERLPENRIAQLVWVPERRNIYAAYFDKEVGDGYWRVFGSYGRAIEQEVTHWMPLPDPPDVQP